MIVEEHLEVQGGVHVGLKDADLSVGDVVGVVVDFMLF